VYQKIFQKKYSSILNAQGKGKVVPVLKHYAMKTYGGVDI
jgi:hypothetical protein